MTAASTRPVVYLIVCAAPRAAKAPELVRLLQEQGWDVCTIATPSAQPFIDEDGLADLTGHPVRTRHEAAPKASELLPPADAFVVCPATFNTINKWAAGIADNLALSLLTEASGRGLPVVAAPGLNAEQARHPAFERSVGQLRAMGITVIYGPGQYEPTPTGSGGRPYPWELITQALPQLGQD